MASRSYVGDKMVEIHKLATLAPACRTSLGASFSLWFSGLLGPDRGSAVGMQQTAYACHKLLRVDWHRHEFAKTFRVLGEF
jgi:hypothetical protein